MTLRGLSGLDPLESGELPALLQGGQQVVETHSLLSAGWMVWWRRGRRKGRERRARWGRGKGEKLSRFPQDSQAHLDRRSWGRW